MPDYPKPKDIDIGHETGKGGYVNYSDASLKAQGILWKKNVLNSRDILDTSAKVHKEYLIVHGLCPCAVCNHTDMDECLKADCQCCSHQCT